MCGFVGFLGFFAGNRLSDEELVLQNMTETIASRGPDSEGYWLDENAVIALGHKRLSILDLTSAGHQPMASPGGRYVIVYNGEVYNHLELRAKLEHDAPTGSLTWCGHSDTETLLVGFELWGLRKTLEHCIGMFSFAVWDTQTSSLTLARDRLGEKPLYYGWQGSGQGKAFLFGSELKALRVHPIFESSIDRNALCLLMRYSFIPAPHSIYQNISKLEPGCFLTVSLAKPEPKIERYWSASEVALSGNANPFIGTDRQAVDKLEELLKSAVNRQMIAEVPLGAFLSGGVDSTTIVALMQAQSNRPIKTFTIGFNEQSYNEAIHAKKIANYLSTDHTELYVSSSQAAEVIPRLPEIYCEPFADSSQIPTFLVAQLARQKVSVVLSGDGGDELFCGYNRYHFVDKLWKRLSYLPPAVRHQLSCLLIKIPPSCLNDLSGWVNTFLPTKWTTPNLGNKLYKAALVLDARSEDELYLDLVSHWDDPSSIVIGGSEPSTILNLRSSLCNGLSGIQSMMLLDSLFYLPDDILTKVDRATMSVSLEGRTPFLDHKVMEFAWQIPQRLKLNQGVGKWVLREVLYRYVPKELIERPKMGFGLPIGEWLRGPLRDWAESLLDEGRLRREGYFHSSVIQQKWQEHLSGARNWQSHLWSVLMFQAWLEENK